MLDTASTIDPNWSKSALKSSKVFGMREAIEAIALVRRLRGSGDAKSMGFSSVIVTLILCTTSPSCNWVVKVIKVVVGSLLPLHPSVARAAAEFWVCCLIGRLVFRSGLTCR